MAAPNGSKPKLQGPKRQHYLPRMYLQGFAGDDGTLAVADRWTGDLRCQPIDSTAVQRHIYTFEDEQGRRRFELEEMFSRVESGLAAAMPRLTAGIGYTAIDLEYLLNFIAFAELRTPGALEDAKAVRAGFVEGLAKTITRSPEQTALSLGAMYRDKGESRSDEQLMQEAQRMVAFTRRGKYRIEVADQAALMECVRLWRPVIESLMDRDVRFVRPQDADCHYVTCDSPVVLDSLSGEPVGFGSANALILFPLTSRCLISLTGNGRRTGKGVARREQVRRTNEAIAKSAHRYIIGSDGAALEELFASLKLSGTRRAPKSVVDHFMTPDGALTAVRRVMPHRVDPIDIGSPDASR
jgi:hypothetical protein